MNQAKDTGRDLRFAVIGAGMAGILSAIKLLKSGFTQITVYEKADSIGGTWPWSFGRFVDLMKAPVIEDYELN